MLMSGCFRDIIVLEDYFPPVMDNDTDQGSAKEVNRIIVRFQVFQFTNKQHKKRAPTALTVECGVCAGPAPDHIHFGGDWQ